MSFDKNSKRSINLNQGFQLCDLKSFTIVCLHAIFATDHSCIHAGYHFEAVSLTNRIGGLSFTLRSHLEGISPFSNKEENKRLPRGLSDPFVSLESDWFL